MFSYLSLAAACSLVVTANGCSSLIEKHPYVVSIEYDNMHVGGGSIISQYYVLTAAAVVSEAPDLDLLSVRTGSNFSNKYGSVHNVCDAKVNPDWSGTTAHAVAMIRIVRPIVFDMRRQPIRLLYYYANLGTNVSVSAWPNLFVPRRTEASLSIFEGTVYRNCTDTTGYSVFCIDRPFEEDWNQLAGRGHPVVDDGMQTGVLVISDDSNITHVADVGNNDVWIKNAMKQMADGPCSSNCEGNSE